MLLFQSTLPLRGATFILCRMIVGSIFQSTLPLRGATGRKKEHFSYFPFQSTLPLRGATPWTRTCSLSLKFQSTLPLRGATLATIPDEIRRLISIHAPLTGSDQLCAQPLLQNLYFNPRSPYGERPLATIPDEIRRLISIHAPLTGSDQLCAQPLLQNLYFNPRSPYGERPMIPSFAQKVNKFQSTLPLRGATMLTGIYPYYYQISIHAPLTGSDGVSSTSTKSNIDFNPRSPYGERQKFLYSHPESTTFQSTLPLRGAT